MSTSKSLLRKYFYSRAWAILNWVDSKTIYLARTSRILTISCTIEMALNFLTFHVNLVIVINARLMLNLIDIKNFSSCPSGFENKILLLFIF